MDATTQPVNHRQITWMDRLARRRVRPVTALLAIRRLLRDPEDTAQVFRIIYALKGDSLQRTMARMQNIDAGRKMLREQPSIIRALNDRAWLATLPEGSLGRAYLAFVEAEVLSADGLVASSEEAERIPMTVEERWLSDRLRDFHDLQHVLTGYGRDPLGELALLAFMTEQVPSRGIDLIVYMGRRKYRQEMPNLPIDAMTLEGRIMARNAAWLPGIPWEQRLGESLAALRAELGLAPPTLYQEIQARASACCAA